MPKFRRKPQPSSKPAVEAIQYKQDYGDTDGCDAYEGSWLVQDEKCKQSHMTDKEFHETFEPIP